MNRKRAGQPAPKYVWFVWSCRRVDDLLWCWESLHACLYDACEGAGALRSTPVLKPGEHWGATSNMLDWLGVTIYVTRADRKALIEVLEMDLPDELKSGRGTDREESFNSIEQALHILRVVLISHIAAV